MKPFIVNIMLAPDMVLLDMAGPYEILSRVPGWEINLIGASLDPVPMNRGMQVIPTATRETAKTPDLLVIPGGAGIDYAMVDPDWIDFVQSQAWSARYVMGICTGSLMLGAAGLLTGRHAGGHWAARDLLARFGAIPSPARVVIDGKYFTSGGVTSGIDMALRIVAEIVDETTAREIQLMVEYDPAPPFPGGTPFTSPAEIVDAVRQAGATRRAEREALVAQAVRTMRNHIAAVVP